MGRHASADAKRGVATWPVVLLVVVILLAGVTTAYLLIVKKQPAAACTGSSVLSVTASPGAARAVNAAAASYNSTSPVARSTCISVDVGGLGGSATIDALSTGWKSQQHAAPGMWVADSATDVSTLDAANSAMTAGHSTDPIATSPVVLAVRAAPAGAVSWKSLTTTGAGSLVLALPDPAVNRASAYALESMIAAGTGTGAAVDVTAVTGAVPMLQALAAGVPAGGPATTGEALGQLAAGSGGFTAVPVVESDLVAFNAEHPTGLTAIYPRGPTVGDALSPIALTAPWINETVADSATAFDAYLTSPAGLAALAKDGLRTPGGRPAGALPTFRGVNPSTPVSVLPDAGRAVRAALATAWSTVRGAVPATTSVGATEVPASNPATVLSSVPPTAPVTARSTPTATPTTAVPTTATPSTAVPVGTAATTAKVTPAPPTTSKSTPPPVVPGAVVTLVLDESGSMADTANGSSKIKWLQNAVSSAVVANPSAALGLWTFSTSDNGTGYTQRVPTGALTDPVAGTTRAAAIQQAVSGMVTGGNSWTYAAIQASYAGAVDAAVPGRANRVVVITDGADTSPGLTRAALIAAIGLSAGQGKNVVLDIIGLGPDVNAEAMTQIALAGGGTYSQLSTLADLQSTLARHITV